MACVKRKWFLLTKYNVKYSSITIAIATITTTFLLSLPGPSLKLRYKCQFMAAGLRCGGNLWLLQYSQKAKMATRLLIFPTAMSEKALAAGASPQTPTRDIILHPGPLTTIRGCSPDPEAGSLFLDLLPHSQSLDPPLDGHHICIVTIFNLMILTYVLRAGVSGMFLFALP